MNGAQRVMACTEVTRWHAVGTTRQQTLAEHQWVVAMLTGRIMDVAFGMRLDISTTIIQAMTHDMDEINSGDPPNFSPVEDIVDKINSLSDNEKCIKFADLIDAEYFIRHYGIGARGEHAKKHTLERLLRAFDGCNSWAIANAARTVWNEL